MSIQFSADEILATAERIEENGVAFYAAGCDAVSDPEAKTLLRHLSSWEVAHVEIFKAMRHALTAEERTPTVFDPDDQMAMYLQSMADRTVFTAKMNPGEMFGPEPELRHILKLALEREKDAVVFYSGIRDMVPARLGRDKIDGIIREEVSHVAMLEKHLGSLQD
jgi:rubrerythrin